MTTKTTKSSKKYSFTTGRRRTATASLKLFSGKAESQVNGQAIDKYFPGAVNQQRLEKPLDLCGLKNKYYFFAKCSGGGKKGQRDAVILALARALNRLNESVYRPILKKEGFLCVDSRIRQRRQSGMGGKSRRQRQSPRR